jgi:hypothetical protein
MIRAAKRRIVRAKGRAEEKRLRRSYRNSILNSLIEMEIATRRPGEVIYLPEDSIRNADEAAAKFSMKNVVRR